VVVNDIQAGNGGFGAVGGNLQMIEVTNDSDGLRLRAGNGGAGHAVANQMKGAAGGAVSQIYISGAFDSTPNSPLLSQLIEVTAGFGGDGLVTRRVAGGVAKMCPVTTLTDLAVRLQSLRETMCLFRP
jgi:hypothetical protein